MTNVTTDFHEGISNYIFVSRMSGAGWFLAFKREKKNNILILPIELTKCKIQNPSMLG